MALTTSSKRYGTHILQNVHIQLTVIRVQQYNLSQSHLFQRSVLQEPPRWPGRCELVAVTQFPGQCFGVSAGVRRREVLLTPAKGRVVRK